MDSAKFDKEKIINYWIESSDDDYDSMMVLHKSRRYNWSLFIEHLMIEKLLKAHYVSQKADYPPYTHNLLRLAELGGLILEDNKKEQLATITAFNINARYDDYKLSFKKLCTPEFSLKWIDIMTELQQWIKQLIKY